MSQPASTNTEPNNQPERVEYIVSPPAPGVNIEIERDEDMKNNTSTGIEEREKAVRVLDDEMCSICADLEKVNTVLAQMINDFFDVQFSQNEAASLFYQFGVERVYANILSDYMSSALRTLKEIGVNVGL